MSFILKALARLWAGVFRFFNKPKPKLAQGAYNNPIIGAGPMHHGRIQP